MPNDFQWPRFINILVYIDDSRANKRKPIHMGSKHRTLFIDTNAIKTTFSKSLTGPFLDCVTSSVPHLGFQYTTSSLKIQIVYGNNFRRAFPMVDISVSFETKKKTRPAGGLWFRYWS